LIYLEDLGLGQEMIDLYLKSEYAHDLKSQIQILRKYRCILIEKMHKDQRQIEDLDCFIYSLTKKA
jgi:phage gp36-like protein